MPNRSRTKILRRLMIPSVVAVAGLAVTMSVTETSVALNNPYKRAIGLSVWQDMGITGKGAIVGNLDGIPPLVAPIALPTNISIAHGPHRSFSKSNIISIAFENDGVHRLTNANLLEHAHQTATLGAIVGSNVGSDDGDPIGIVPDAQALVGWFALDRDDSGFFTDGPGVSPTKIFDSITYALFAMTGQEYADVVSTNLLGLTTPYQVATVINSSYGSLGFTSRRGEDNIARIYNACVSMTDATIVAPTSNDGNLEDNNTEDTSMELTNLGRVYSPGGALNTIAVGYIDRDFNGVSSYSGKGPMQGQNYADEALGNLYPVEDIDFVNPFTPMDADLESFSGVFLDVRAGVDIVTMGDMLTLPGENLVINGDFFSTTGSSDWTGVSFASAIVAGACALVHELGDREGLSTSSVVTRAVLLNSANKSDERPGVGFDNMQMVDAMDEDMPEVTTIGLDEERGAGSLDLVQLLSQYYLGAVVTDYEPFDGIEGFTTTQSTPPAPADIYDSLSYTFPDDDTTFGGGTDPLRPFITGTGSPLSLSCQMSFGGRLDPEDPDTRDPWLDGRVETQVASLYGPFTEGVEAVINQAQGGIVPMGRRDDPDLGGDNPDLGGGTPPDIPSGDTGEVVPSSGGGTGGRQQFRSGWDHGMVGEGHIDLPIGPITPNSGISVTLTWNRTEEWNLSPSSFASANDIIGFGGGDISAVDPTLLNVFEYEDLNLELWREATGPGAQRLVGASRGVWNNTECVYFPYTGGPPENGDDGPFGNTVANYFVRIVYEQTLYDYGGFWFCNGPPTSTPKQAMGKFGFTDQPRSQVEYGLAWYVEMNTDGNPRLQAAINPETHAVDVSIPGLRTNLDQLFTPIVGDLNADFLVDYSDASLLLQNMGSTDPIYDLNNDGIADALDLTLVTRNLGQIAEPIKPTKEAKKAERDRRKAYKKSVNDRRKANKKASKQIVKDAKQSARSNNRR
ncbi:MAG: S8 family serine peptidase [Phycisphaeraceae bacterium]|nr:S8 family serine peptidase [Phycisphaeraceae bacterium]MCB9847483.1 S8 family serine peptidase [Phycisphaeraceae bacterium]